MGAIRDDAGKPGATGAHKPPDGGIPSSSFCQRAPQSIPSHRAIPSHVCVRQINKVFASGLLVGCKRIDLRGNRFQRWDAEVVRRAIEAGRSKGLGFDPSEVLLDDQDWRPDPRLCTTHKAVWVERSSDFRLRLGMPSKMLFCEKDLPVRP